MIRFLLVFCFFSLVLTLQAQESQSYGKIQQKRVTGSLENAIIHQFQPEEDGYKSYRKEVCPFTGEVIYSEVEYSSRDGRYVPATSGKCEGPEKSVPVRHQLSEVSVRPSASAYSVLPERD